MPKVRQVLCHVSVELAKRDRICHRDRKGHGISKGSSCLVIADGVNFSKKNYCSDCARAILEQAQLDLTGLKDQLGID